MKKILLTLLPFWTPLIPPMGISCLKSFLQDNGYSVKTLDANTDEEFRKIYDSYFNELNQLIPQEKKGNFYNIGIDVMQNHMTAFLHRDSDIQQHFKLVKELVDKTFFHQLNNEGIKTLDKIIGCFFENLDRYFTEIIETIKPDVLGISVYKGTFAASLFCFRLTKEKYPHIMTVMGGGIFADQLAINSPNFYFFLEKTPYIDKIIIGEGEQLFLKLLKNDLPISQRVFSRKDNDLGFLDITSVNIPDFSDFDLDYYSALAAYSSRSCPFQCGFCAETVNWGKYRKKKATQVVDEMMRIYQKYGTQLFLMTDSILNPIAQDLANELSKSEIALYWDGYMRADKETCDTETTILWRRGGLYRARLGIESGSERILKLMDKRLTLQQIKSSLYSLSYAGIKTSTYWVIGYPGETIEDFRDTLDFLEEIKEFIYEAECNPFRYYPVGQVNSGHWAQNNKSGLLYPKNAKDRLIIQTWELDGPGPDREEIYHRVSQFVQHCKKIGIPNPYSWQEIHKADERWQKLHSNAVKPLIEFKSGKSYIDECKNIENIILLNEKIPDEGDFDF